MEHSLIQIRTANNELLTLGCVYRSPNSPDTNNENMNNLIYKLDDLKSAYKLLIVDFNCGKICWEDGTTTTPLEAAFMNCLQDTYMTQQVSEPTRGRNGEDPSILDLVMSNYPNIVSEISYEAPLGKSDHACLKFNINCFRTEQGKNRKFHLYDKGDYLQMASELNNVDWQQKIGHLGDPHEAYEVFCQVLCASLIDRYVPA